eukprot:CAMPEP_0198665848 /NCGR_PEP_ID=MMETSP1467-20131203/62288_1 /TAXON_ID=1462469 /ORGANISM="unid. sp., Strain CCMP2135" /LENGTH=42 /DNA_ID= /DNA_START= /DNA_END= /DNA_ORIENTATION=
MTTSEEGRGVAVGEVAVGRGGFADEELVVGGQVADLLGGAAG